MPPRTSPVSSGVAPVLNEALRLTASIAESASRAPRHLTHDYASPLERRASGPLPSRALVLPSCGARIAVPGVPAPSRRRRASIPQELAALAVQDRLHFL